MLYALPGNMICIAAVLPALQEYCGRQDVSLTPETSLKELFADIWEQIRDGLAHSDYPYIARNAMVRTKDYFYFFYQEDNWYMLHKMPPDLEEVDIEYEDIACHSDVDAHILDTEEGLVMLLVYCRDLYPDAEIQHFMETMRRLISPFHR